MPRPRLAARAAVAALAAALLAPAPARAAHGRLTLDVLAGGGAVTDLFPGAGLGRDAYATLEPALALDLAFSPAWKGAVRLEGRAARYAGSGLAMGGGGGEAEGRLVFEGGEASLAAGGDWTGYSSGAPADLASPAAPAVLASRALRLRPMVRLRALGLTWRAALVGARVAADLPEGGAAVERDGALLLGAGRPLGPVQASATWRLARAASARDDFTYTAHALLLAAVGAAGPLDLAARLELSLARYRTGAEERLLRTALAASLPIGERLAAEAAWSWAGSRVSGPGPAGGGRHLLSLGLRLRAEPAAW